MNTWKTMFLSVLEQQFHKNYVPLNQNSYDFWNKEDLTNPL